MFTLISKVQLKAYCSLPAGKIPFSFSFLPVLDLFRHNISKVIHIAHALVADEGGKPGQEDEVKEEEVELEEHCSTFDVAVHR